VASDRHLLVVVDDDDSVREALPDLLREFGYAAEAFSSAEAFLASGLSGQVDCIILDITMPGMSGPELQQELIRRGQPPPIVFITAHKDKTLWPRLMERGAAACLLKPFSEDALLQAIRAAVHG
jgi:FixJ family two-component response regulator